MLLPGRASDRAFCFPCGKKRQLMGNKLDDRSTRHDRFHQKAKREGFLARAVYKLEEIDGKHAIFDGGTRVLDLGCAPG